MLFLALFSYSLSFAAPQADITAIQSMAGCFDVDFHFQETGTTDPNYPTRSKDYHEQGLEWVELDKSTPEHIALQHVLIIPDANMTIKHWRQEWDFEAVTRFQFMGNLLWQTIDLFMPEGKWTQRVSQVDDSPRYECDAQWTHTPGANSYWECATYAPLPRREFSQRSDYNILDRGNKHEITADGWLHIQNNKKMLINSAVMKQIATEKGLDTYTSVDSSKCADGQNFWKKESAAWHVIQDMWKHIRSHHPDLQFQTKSSDPAVTGKLFENLGALAAQASDQSTLDETQLSKAAHDLIHGYLDLAH